MDKRQLEAEKAKLAAEEKQLKHLKGIYKKAADDIAKKIEISNGKISVLLANWDELTDEQKSIYQSQIYQRDFQQSLQKQINGFLKDLNSKQYKSVDEYLKDSYKTGYIGAMYDIAGQGIPIVTPIDQKQVVKAMTHDTKLSKRLYTRLGEDVELLKKRVANNISRGIATADSYANIARNISNGTNVSINRTMTIARTEGHRIQVQATSDAQHDAKDKGADVVKQWDSTLDGRTRPHHRQLDGQIRELDEPFEVDGMKVKYPSGFGIAAEDINCRCALLQRAKWNLGEEELETLKERAAFFGLDKTKDFEDYKKKYLKLPEKADKINVENILKKPIKSSDEKYNALLTELERIQVAYRPVIDHTSQMTDEEIISALSGGDNTAGSCASVGLAYIGQKQGWNILDFRDGKSRKFFSSGWNLSTLSNVEGLKVLKADGKSSVTVGNRLLKQCEPGKEYYLCVGRHASIVRKTEDGKLQYLELQSAKSSGWTDFDGNPRYTLSYRFGCTSRSDYGRSSLYDFMIDIEESDFSTDDFKSLLGYINTAEDEQKKGQYGTIK